MFGNTIAYRRMLKKDKLNKELTEAQENKNDWKIKQIEAKIAMFNIKNYPKLFWDSNQKGTYIKKESEV